jgi:hypothetical protein
MNNNCSRSGDLSLTTRKAFLRFSASISKADACRCLQQARKIPWLYEFFSKLTRNKRPARYMLFFIQYFYCRSVTRDQQPHRSTSDVSTVFDHSLGQYSTSFWGVFFARKQKMNVG